MSTSDELRRKAEQLVEENAFSLEKMTPEEISLLVYELQVHQLELEMQNEELRLAENALRKAEQKYREQYNLSALGFCELDQKGAILRANPRVSEQLGTDRVHLINTFLGQYVLPEDQDMLYFHLKHLFETGQPQECELRIKNPAGAPLFVKVESRLHQPDGEIPQTRTILTNETSIKQTEQQLQLFSQMFMALADPVILMDPRGKILDLNPQAEQSYGWRKEALIGQNFNNFISSQDDQELEDLLTRCQNEKKIRDIEGLYLTGTGKQLPVLQSFSLIEDSRGEPLSIAISTKDIPHFKRHEQELTQYQEYLKSLSERQEIKVHNLGTQLTQETTERQEAQQKLKQIEQQYRSLAETMKIGVMIVQDEHIMFVNDAIMSMLGYRWDDMVGNKPENFFREDHVEFFRQQLDQQTRNGEPVLGAQTPFLAKEGGEIWLQGNQVVIQWNGRPGTLLTLQDVTQEKLREIQTGQETPIHHQLKAGLHQQRTELNGIIGKTPVMQSLYDQIMMASTSDFNVVITGESGVGKELVARTIHARSPRVDKPFVTVNCGSISKNLFEREFFGHRKGSFTGADRSACGYFQAAQDGILFLDEVGELTLAMQVTLLRAIEHKEFTPVGGTDPIKADIRILAATNRNLEDDMERGAFRADFYYRLHVLTIIVPPLRDRKADLPLLVEHILEKYGEKSLPPKLPGRLMNTFYEHHWPGNVRELENLLKRYLSGQTIDCSKLRPKQEEDAASGSPQPILEPETEDLQSAVAQFEKQFILAMLERYRWHKTNTAKVLGISRRVLYRKLEQHGIPL